MGEADAPNADIGKYRRVRERRRRHSEPGWRRIQDLTRVKTWPDTMTGIEYARGTTESCI
jgi:hypothetical protein